MFGSIRKFAVEERPEPKGELEAIFYSGKCRRIHKWTHYFEIYERHLAKYRGSDFRMLEIGVFGGGSLDMWRTYFGPRAIVYGIDINPDCKALDTKETPVRIGSQADPEFLCSVVQEMGGLDVVLDDGSHKGAHQWASFNALFPLLRNGGLYIVEDTHTSYWLSFSPLKSAIGLAKRIVDDMHAWYSGKRTKTPGQTQVGSVHFYDSVFVIEKRIRERPRHTIVG